MNYVIIGNGPAGVGAVEAIRQRDREGSITLLSQESEHTYSRPLISYWLLGKTDEARMRYRGEDFYLANGVDFRPGAAAQAIDVAARRVSASDGRVYPYDRLLIATGSRPLAPPIPGLSQISYHAFMTKADAAGLKRALTPKSRVLIVGAGLIGLKCAEGIRHLCREITVVDKAPQILPSILDEAGAAFVQKHVEAQGITFRLKDSAASFAPGVAALESGVSLPFDLLVMAVGVRPHVELAQAAGIKADQGIDTDAWGRTSQPDIYAAGDCAKSFDLTTGHNRVLALLPNAYRQGETAGTVMAGGSPAPYGALPMNAMGLFGLHMITAGSYEGDSHLVSVSGGYKRLFTREDRLMGYILIGEVERAGIYTALIRDKTPISSLDFGLMLESPQLMAFSKRERMARMGGERV